MPKPVRCDDCPKRKQCDSCREYEEFCDRLADSLSKKLASAVASRLRA